MLFFYAPDESSNSAAHSADFQLPVDLRLPVTNPRGLPDKPHTGGSSYVSRTSTESHLGVDSALSSHPDSVALVTRNFLVGQPEFDLYGEHGSKSVASTNDNSGETEEKIERNEEDIESEPGLYYSRNLLCRVFPSTRFFSQQPTYAYHVATKELVTLFIFRTFQFCRTTFFTTWANIESTSSIIM